MIAEALDGTNWGENRKAANAATKRVNTLKDEGYIVYSTRTTALGGNMTYYIFAFDTAEDHEIKPFNPDSHPRGRRLNARTIHIGMSVAVETVQGERIDHRHGWRGTVVGVNLTREGEANATVQFAGPDSKRVKIEVYRLRQVA